ncbi:MAG: C10 family peptidase [Treponema sp.]|nr:C10 family peptidase [Treponema sp.]
MKRVISKITVIFTIVCIISAFLACKHNVNNIDKDVVDNYDYIQFEDDGYLERAEIERKNQLINIAKIGKWKTSDTVIENTLKDIFNNEMKSFITTSTPLTLKRIKLEKAPVIPLENSNRSSKIEECKDFEILIYEMNASPFIGHAITSTDKRIGNIIAIVESEYQEDISDCEFAVDYMTGFEVYIQHIADLWNSITDEDLSNEDIQLRTPPIYVTDPAYEFFNWVKHSGNNTHILKTKWDQEPAPFNSCVVAVKGGNARYAGCTTVQVGQILAFHKYTKYTSSPNLARIKRKWPLASEWDGNYNWDTLTWEEKPDNNSLRDVQVQVGALLYDIAKGCLAIFGSNGTSILNVSRNIYLRKCGYTYKGTSGYSLDKIKESIDAGCPVPVTGTSKEYNSNGIVKYVGHAFIVDGYFNMSCVAKKDGADDIPITADFVHCNVGWGGRQNGYYLSGVFAMNRGALLKDNNGERHRTGSTKERYFNLFLRQLNMLRPKG